MSKFKKIEEHEMYKIVTMLKSDEENMRNLGIQLLSRNEKYRFSFLTIVLFHIIAWITSIIGVVSILFYISTWYAIPLILAIILQLLWSLFYLADIVERRKGYDDLCDLLING